MPTEDFWWDVNDRPPPENHARCLREVLAARPRGRPPLLVILGYFPLFGTSALHKAAQLSGYFNVQDILATSPGDLSRDDVRFLKWSPFSEVSISAAERRLLPPGSRVLNDAGFDCRKENVQGVFSRIAPRGSTLDPLSHQGVAVAKSGFNAQHDGTLTVLPVQAAAPGMVYERLVDNSVGDASIFDIRLICIAGHFPTAYVKLRPRERRFENVNSAVHLFTPLDVLSEDEIDMCRAFCREIAMDYGELDVLRDRSSGEIVIVDANGTPAGPPRTLPPEERRLALRLMALAVRHHVFGLPT